jgi:hypothetical protein
MKDRQGSNAPQSRGSGSAGGPGPCRACRCVRIARRSSPHLVCLVGQLSRPFLGPAGPRQHVRPSLASTRPLLLEVHAASERGVVGVRRYSVPARLVAVFLSRTSRCRLLRRSAPALANCSLLPQVVKLGRLRYATGTPLGLWPTAHSHDNRPHCRGEERIGLDRPRLHWQGAGPPHGVAHTAQVGRGRCAQGANGRYYKGRDDSLASPRASFDRLLRVLSDTWAFPTLRAGPTAHT